MIGYRQYHMFQNGREDAVFSERECLRKTKERQLLIHVYCTELERL